jgi:hypothetical protein
VTSEELAGGVVAALAEVPPEGRQGLGKAVRDVFTVRLPDAGLTHDMARWLLRPLASRGLLTTADLREMTSAAAGGPGADGEDTRDVGTMLRGLMRTDPPVLRKDEEARPLLRHLLRSGDATVADLYQALETGDADAELRALLDERLAAGERLVDLATRYDGAGQRAPFRDAIVAFLLLAEEGVEPEADQAHAAALFREGLLGPKLLEANKNALRPSVVAGLLQARIQDKVNTSQIRSLF